MNRRLWTAHPIVAIPAMLEEKGLIRASDLAPFGLRRRTLGDLVESRTIRRVSRGVYALYGAAVDPLAVVAKRVPRGVFCIQTALYLHGLAAQPEKVWIALGSKDRPPKVYFPPLRLVRLSGAARHEGVEIHVLGGTEIRVYSLAKTLADCLKFRNKIGEARALAVVTRCLDEKRCTLDELRRFAAICRVARVLDAHLSSRLTKI